MLLVHQFLFTVLNFPEYCEKYAKPEDAWDAPEVESSDEELSEDGDASGDDGVAGEAVT